MPVSPTRSRLMLAVSVVLVVAVSIVVAVGVIPPVRVATAPDITPETAVSAFWVNVALQALAALIVALIAALSKGRSRFSTACLVITGIVVLFLGFTLSDAALAFREAGMSTVAMLLFLCAGADALAGALAIAAALLRPHKTREAST